MKRFLFSTLLVPFLISNLVSAGQPKASETIDAILAKSWKEKGIEPAKIVDDETFVRRIYLDAVGRIPTATEVRTFVANDAETKRADLINELLESEGYANHMFNFWADILRIHSQQGGGQNIVPAYVNYVKDSLRQNKPYDEFVRELVTAEGETYSNGAIGYYYRDRGMPFDNMANTVRIFLGTRLECAQCHNHPFDKWTQMDFYHMAAFSYGMNVQNRQGGQMFQEVQREMNADKSIDRDQKRNLQRALQEIRRPIRNTPMVTYQAEKVPQLPHDYQYDDAEPKAKVTERVMFGEEPEIASPGERLHRYADWMTSPDNERFTKVIANRMWKKAMGLGLVEPVDEFLDSTTASNPELFTFLEEEMKRQDYDLKGFLRILFNTQVYQREASAEDVLLPTDYAFTGPLMRRMSAEQIWDSVVTLINPKPEVGNWKREQEMILRNAGTEMMTAALAKKSKEQLMKDVKAIAGEQKGLQEKLIALQKKQTKAREDKDKDQIRKLSRESNQIRRRLSQKVYDQVYAPVLKKTKGERVAFMMPEGMGKFEMKIDQSKIDQSGRVKPDVLRELTKKEEEIIEKEMDDLGITDAKLRRSYLGFRRSISSNYTRAANMPSPAQPGHFLRQFGQSDRETIENAESAASVTQALTMLNGPIFQTVTNANSVISRELQTVASPEEKIETLYLSVLGRKPDLEEKELILTDVETRGDQLYQDVLFALMNTQEFYFVR